MNATQLLKRQHKDVAKLFERVEKAKNHAERAELFAELAADIAAHDAIEREIFYPACEKKMGKNDLLGEALVEHGVIEFSLYLADDARGAEGFTHKLTVLREMIEHHVKEEEKELFPKVEAALGAPRLEELGEAMEARFEQVKKTSFRPGLRANLRQVIAGKVETVPPKSAARRGTFSAPHVGVNGTKPRERHSA